MLNRCEFIGNLGADPEVRSLGSTGDKVANLRIAVSERWRDKNTGETKEKTEWVSVVVWGGLVKVVESYLKKGSKVYIAGQLQTRKWQDQSGNDRWTTEIVLRGFDAKLLMLDGASGRSGGGDERGRLGQGDGYDGRGSGGGRPQQQLDDEIPF